MQKWQNLINSTVAVAAACKWHCPWHDAFTLRDRWTYSIIIFNLYTYIDKYSREKITEVFPRRLLEWKRFKLPTIHARFRAESPPTVCHVVAGEIHLENVAVVIFARFPAPIVCREWSRKIFVVIMLPTFAVSVYYYYLYVGIKF